MLNVMARPISYCLIVGCDARCVGSGLCEKHYRRLRRHGDPMATPRFDPLEVRFWRYVEKTDQCWNWTGATNLGYGTFCISQRPTKVVRAHRYAYELLVGPIPTGLVIDHLCRNHGCVNPSHMEPVTNRENVLRGDTLPARNAAKTHCVHGHLFNDANTKITKGGGRRCRTCDRNWMRAKRDLLRRSSS